MTRTAVDGVVALSAALRAEGGTVAGLLGGEVDLGSVPDAPGLAQRSAAGPMAGTHELEYELLLEMILEGSRLHYGPHRVVQTDDPDLALLLGDQLYALGLSRLAALENVDAIAELADLISLVAQAHAASDPGLAEAVWEAGAMAIGWGAGEQHIAAKALARAGDARAESTLRAAAASAQRTGR